MKKFSQFLHVKLFLNQNKLKLFSYIELYLPKRVKCVLKSKKKVVSPLYSTAFSLIKEIFFKLNI